MILSTLSEISSIIQTVIAVRNEYKNKREYNKLLGETQSRLENIEKNQLLSRQEILNIIKEQTGGQPYPIIQKLFGSIDSESSANRAVALYKGSENLSNVNFRPNDLMFSSFGTAGYIKNLRDGKGQAIYHAGGDDKGRLFLVRWGIGWYYRTFMKADSFLGFPTSNEFSTKDKGRRGSRNDFEGGYIEYIEEYDKLQIYRTGLKGVRLIGEHQF